MQKPEKHPTIRDILGISDAFLTAQRSKVGHTYFPAPIIKNL